MDLEKEDQCWTCQHSSFNPIIGKIHCYQDEGKRTGLCPFPTNKQDQTFNGNIHGYGGLSLWRTKLAKLIK